MVNFSNFYKTLYKNTIILLQSKFGRFFFLCLLFLLPVGLVAQEKELVAQEKELVADSLETNTQDTTQTKDSGFELEHPINYNADDSVIFDIAGKKVFMFKNGTVSYGDIELKADYIEFDLENNEVFATGLTDSLGNPTGKPVFQEGNETFNTDSIRYNFKSKKGLIYGVFSEQSDGFLHSEITKRQENEDIHLRHGKYTTCDLEHPHFYIALSEAIVKPGDKIISAPLYFVIEDVPLPIGLPFGFFPAKKGRSSGFIIPTYGEDKERGFFLRQGGYYLSISEYWDLAIMGDIYSKGTYEFNARSKYKLRYKFNGNFDLKYSRRIQSEKGLLDYAKENAFSLKWQHSQDPKANPTQVFSANVNFDFNSYNKHNATNLNDLLENQKSSNISYRKRFPNAPFNFTANLNASQNTRTNEVSLSLPVMNLNMNTLYPLKRKKSVGSSKWYEQLSVGYSSNFRNSIRTTDSTMFKENIFDKMLTGYKHNIPISLPIKFERMKMLTITPNLNYTGYLYTKSLQKTFHKQLISGNDTLYNKVVSDTISGMKYAHQYETSISASLVPKFVGMYTMTNPWLKKRIKAVRHVITPSLTFSYKPKSGIDDKKYYKHVQTDTLGKMEKYSIFEKVGKLGAPGSSRESGSISFNLKNSLEMKVKNPKDTTEEYKKIKILENLSFRTSYNVFADSMNLSDISFSGSTRILDNININFDGVFDPYTYDRTNGKKEKYYVWEKSGYKLLRLKSARVTMGLNFKSKTDTKGRPVKDEFDSDEIPYQAFSIPWSFKLDYSMEYKTRFKKEKQDFDGKLEHKISFNGNLDLTNKWGVSFSSGYDFDARELTSTQIFIKRNLHCWNMEFSWIPFGRRQSYSFRIAINSSVFKGVEYKIDRRDYEYY